MPLGKFLKRDNKDREKDDKEAAQSPSPPEFKFVRTDTNSQTIIHPPTGFPDEKNHRQSHLGVGSNTSGCSSSGGGRSRSGSTTGQKIRHSILGHHRTKSDPPSSSSRELPSIDNSKGLTDADWERRATLLVQSTSPPVVGATPGRSRAGSVVSIRLGDDDTIQEAIRLHEAQQYAAATALFKKLADPDGVNNVLSQVIYALCLRHGWGCPVDEAKAAEYLRMAANNAAEVEQEALRAGMAGGSAKGELVLAIYELANCYRQGWGMPKDLARAFQYYLTAANLGDSDAMNEVATCYLEGYGTKKNKYEAARYFRLAEAKGNKTVGNSWIYKDKYIKYEKDGAKK